jgi:hypothetical protein
MKMKPNTRYQVKQPRAEPKAATAADIPLLALVDDLDSINSELSQSMKHLHRAADMTFDLARKLSIIQKDKCQDSK